VDGVRLLTFDCYGTLIDWETGIRRYLAGVLARKPGAPALEDFYRRWYHQHELPTIAGPFRLYREVLQVSLQGALRDAGLPVALDDGADFGTAMETWEPFAESAPVLAQLATRYRLAVISNSQHDIIRHAAAKLGDPFTYIVTAEDARAYKPAARPFEMALERAGVGVAETVHIAESQLVDLPRSKPMGIRTAWINRNGEALRPGTPAPDWEFRDLRPLPALFGAGGA
jgi:2-haloacid dehalogenase